jgi:hypothetical protein
MALRDRLAAELTAVKQTEQAADEERLEALEGYGNALTASLERVSASQEDLLEAISAEVDLDH